MQMLRLQLQAMVEAVVSSFVHLQVLPDSAAQDQPLTKLSVAGRAAVLPLACCSCKGGMPARCKQGSLLIN